METASSAARDGKCMAEIFDNEVNKRLNTDNIEQLDSLKVIKCYCKAKLTRLILPRALLRIERMHVVHFYYLMWISPKSYLLGHNSPGPAASGF